MYIVETGTPILGMDLVTTLNLQISGGQRLPGNQPTCVMIQSAVEAAIEPFIDFGCVKSFIHMVKTRPEVSPLQQKLRRLPLSVRDAVSAWNMEFLRKLTPLNGLQSPKRKQEVYVCV